MIIRLLLLMLHGGLYLLWLRWCLNHYLVVLIAVVVADLLLIVSTSPLPIDDVLVLVGARGEGIVRQSVLKDMAAWVNTLHLHPLLPVAEASNDEDVVAALAPGENVLGFGRCLRHL